MEIVGIILWIIAGAIYVAFQTAKDGDYGCLGLLLLFGGIIGGLALIAPAVDDGGGAGVGIAIALIVALIAVCVHKSKEFDAEGRKIEYEADVVTVTALLEEAGYHVDQKIIRNVCWLKDFQIRDSQTGELKPVEELYQYCCVVGRSRYIGSTGDAANRFAKEFGIQEKEIPRNKNATQEECHAWIEADKACLKKHGAEKERTRWNSMDRLLRLDATAGAEGRRQRDALLIQKLLEREGLAYPEEYAFDLPTNPAYLREFDRFWQRVQKKLEYEAKLEEAKLLPKPYKRKKELDMLYQANPAEFEREIGHKICETEPPFQYGEMAVKFFKDLAIVETLIKEGYCIDPRVQEALPGIRRIIDEIKFLATCSRTDFEKAVGCTVTDDNNLRRMDLISAIGERDGWLYAVGEFIKFTGVGNRIEVSVVIYGDEGHSSYICMHIDTKELMPYKGSLYYNPSEEIAAALNRR